MFHDITWEIAIFDCSYDICQLKVDHFTKFDLFLLILFSITTTKINQNIIQEGHFWKFLENVLVWAYQVAFRDLKNAINSVAVDSQLNVLAFFPKCA